MERDPLSYISLTILVSLQAAHLPDAERTGLRPRPRREKEEKRKKRAIFPACCLFQGRSKSRVDANLSEMARADKPRRLTVLYKHVGSRNLRSRDLITPAAYLCIV